MEGSERGHINIHTWGQRLQGLPHNLSWCSLLALEELAGSRWTLLGFSWTGAKRRGREEGGRRERTVGQVNYKRTPQVLLSYTGWQNPLSSLPSPLLPPSPLHCSSRTSISSDGWEGTRGRRDSPPQLMNRSWSFTGTSSLTLSPISLLSCTPSLGYLPSPLTPSLLCPSFPSLPHWPVSPHSLITSHTISSLTVFSSPIITCLKNFPQLSQWEPLIFQ